MFRNVLHAIAFLVFMFLVFPILDVFSQVATLSEPARKQLADIRWIAFAPTDFNPDPQHKRIPNDESIKTDLEVIRNSGFDGLVTYGAELTSIPRIAKEVGFRGILLGVWDPNNADELAKAKKSAENPIVLGIIVGNEGLTFDRYDFPTLKNAVEEMAGTTRKPVTTTEVVDLYASQEELLTLGSFLAPNAHPYHASVTNPAEAVEWTVQKFKDLQKKTDKFILFKEVGLPTDGDTGLSEKAQAEYYLSLKDKPLNFVYFEAFDAPWKQGPNVEPYWGLFHADRTKKPVVNALQFVLEVPNNFFPSGWMGDGEVLGEVAIEVNEFWSDDPRSPPTCYKWVYKADNSRKGWVAVAWQQPDGNWGDDPGLDLTGYKRLTFWIKGERGGERVTIKTGGNTKPGASYPASFAASLGLLTLKDTWEKKEIDLTSKNLSNVVCGFVWAASKAQNRNGCTFYLDDIQFEK